MPGEDTSGPAEKAIYAAYNSLVEAAFKDLANCYRAAGELKKDRDETQQSFETRRAGAYEKCRATFKSALENAGSALRDALTIAEQAEGKVPKPKHHGEWF